MRSILGVLLIAGAACGQAPDVLPGSTRWQAPENIPAEQYRELRQYYERKIAEVAQKRRPFTDVAVARQRFRTLIGGVDRFLEPKPESTALTDFGPFTATLLQWPVLPLGSQPPTRGSAGTLVREYGILLTPKSAERHPAVIVVPDADQSAADLAGLTSKLPAEKQRARTLAAGGFVVFVPFFTQRRAFSEPWTNDRSWLFRLAYQTGHHVIGDEVQQVSSACRYLQTLAGVDRGRIAVAGSGQGGLIAFYSAAVDDNLQAALVSNYLNRREPPFEEPEDRLVWNLLGEFGDREIASLIAPRPLWTEERELAKAFRGEPTQSNQPARSMDPDEISRIVNARFSQWQARYRNLALDAYAVREAAWQPDTSSIKNYRRWAKPKLEEYLNLTGRYPDASGPLEARTTKIYHQDEFTGYRLSVRLYEGVHAYGILLVPRGIKPGERRPVVFTQHGLGGTPEDALGVVPNKAADAVYSRFGMHLAKRGYIVFAPMISTQESAERDALTRRSHLLGQIPLGIEVKKFGRVIDYLATLPYVDPQRFAFYGLSYGGYTALWTGPGEQRFRVVITSGHFNDWDIKTSDLTQGTSFLFFPNNFDMFNFNILNRLTHSELGMLVAPRPFMIEVGDRDGVVVAPRRFPDVEMERVMDLYRRLGIADRGRIARFDGPHMVDGREAFAFLDKWLDWTPRQ